MLKDRIKKILVNTGIYKYYFFLRYVLKYKIKGAFSPDKNFYTLSPPLLIAINASLRKAQALNILEGTDYMEFGLFRGFSFWYAQAAAKEAGVVDVHYYGFDSFKGLPEIYDPEFSTGDFKCGRDLVEENLNRYGVDWGKTFLIEGFYNESLNEQTQNQYNFRKCAICVIDCDLYEATKDVLNFIRPILNKTCFLIFDDWNCYDADNKSGERKAFAEFIQTNPDIKVEDYGQFGQNCQMFLLASTV